MTMYWEAIGMRQQLIVGALCVFFAIGALAIAVRTLVTGELERQGIDALFLILVCLLVTVVFALIPVQAVRQGLLRDLLSRRRGKAGSEDEQQASTGNSD